MHKRSTQYEGGMLVIWIIVAVTSCSWAALTSNYEIFSRAGSLLVICAVASEYSHFKVQIDLMKSSTRGTGGLGGGVGPIDQGRLRNSLSKLSHIAAVLGTLIWGYGDWALSQILAG